MDQGDFKDYSRSSLFGEAKAMVGWRKEAMKECSFPWKEYMEIDIGVSEFISR